jgi:SAM-dependent methyltransferase
LILFEDHPLSGECETVVCKTCGLGFNQRPSTAEAYVAHYAALSKYATSFSPLANADKFSRLADIFIDLYPNRSSSILDVGCGAGGFLAKLKEYGYRNLSAMDPTPACVTGVQRDLGIDARLGVLAEPPFPPNSFDVVISTGVLEHLLLPADDLKALKNLLVPFGAAFIVTPDASRYTEFLDAPFQDFNIEHINHFSPDTLNTLFIRQGWQKVALGQDVLSHTPKWSEPVVYGLFRPLAGENRSPLPAFDKKLADNLKSYVRNSAVLLDKIDRHLRRELAGISEVIVWGAGQTSSLLLSQTILKDLRIRAVVDSNPAYAGRSMAGAPVGGPELRGSFNGPVVVATIREYQAVERIIRETLKWDNRILSLIG